MSTCIDWLLCQLDGSFFGPVDRDFITTESQPAEIKAQFNPSELSSVLAAILGDHRSHNFDKGVKFLYGMIRHRYFSTPRGLLLMFERH
jgi:hypothetical protein